MLIAFYIVAALAVASAFNILFLRSPVYCALSLVGCFFLLGIIFILLNNEFVAVVQVLIYAGAIMVLFLFVIMLLNLRPDSSPRSLKFGIAKILGIGLTVGILAQLIGVFGSSAAKLGPMGEYSAQRVTEEGSLEIVAELMLTEYVLPFEIISILLMVSIMGAVVLAKKRPPPEEEESQP
ncbi:MAG: NADH-quinone oxidoreductase subunit J [SAR324 cluster bacterium]|nr:NADH-quinone oxidoreductase subunit J [SAR324 cluster bacterium]